MLGNRFFNRVFLFLDQFGNESLLGKRTQLADVLLVAAQDGGEVELLAVLVGDEHRHFVVAGLVGIVDDVGGIVRKLLLLTEIAVMHSGIDITDGTIETDLIQVVVAACIVEVKQATVFQRLGQDAVANALTSKVLQNLAFIKVMVGIKIELLALEADFLIRLQSIVVSVRAENDLAVIVGEHRVQVGVPVVGDLLQGVRK